MDGIYPTHLNGDETPLPDPEIGELDLLEWMIIASLLGMEVSDRENYRQCPFETRKHHLIVNKR